MKSRQSITGKIFTFLAAFGLLVLFFLFAPIQVGGRTSYLYVNGVSMEPNYHKGDLIIARAASNYQVGDIAAYQNPDLLNAIVIHRIVSINSDQYIFKGDNNSWLDSYTPTKNKIIGKLWIYLPKFGNVILWLRAPLHLVIILVFVGGILMIKPTQKITRKGKKIKTSPVKQINFLQGVLLTFGVISALFVALAIYAFTKPLQIESTNNLSYLQNFKFDYSAKSPSGIYDGNIIQSGDPIFPNLTCQVNFKFNYQLTGINIQDVTGSQYLSIIIQDPASGWQRTVTSIPARSFKGNSYSSEASMNICVIETMAANYLSTTKLESKFFTLTVLPVIDFDGKINGKSFKDSFAPSLVFYFDPTHFYIPVITPGIDPLTSSKQGTIKSITKVPNTIDLFEYKLPVDQVRKYVLYGMAGSLFILLISILLFSIATKNNEDISIRIRYGSILVDIQDPDQEFRPQSKVIDVASIDYLAKIAERENLFIVHIKRDLFPPIHQYYVKSEQDTYRYTAMVKSNKLIENEPL